MHSSSEMSCYSAIVLVSLLSGDWFSFFGPGCLIKNEIFKIEICFCTAVPISDGFVFAKSAFFYPRVHMMSYT